MIAKWQKQDQESRDLQQLNKKRILGYMSDYLNLFAEIGTSKVDIDELKGN